MQYYLQELFEELNLIWILILIGLFLLWLGLRSKRKGNRSKTLIIGLVLLALPIYTVVGKLIELRRYEKNIVGEYVLKGNESLTVLKIRQDGTFSVVQPLPCLRGQSGHWEIREGDDINLFLQYENGKSDWVEVDYSREPVKLEHSCAEEDLVLIPKPNH